MRDERLYEGGDLDPGNPGNPGNPASPSDEMPVGTMFFEICMDFAGTIHMHLGVCVILSSFTLGQSLD